MGQKRICFTEEEIKILSANPHTLSVTSSRISFTLEAKKKILELDDAGKTRREIIVELGYDPVMLGKERARDIVRNTRREAESQYIHFGLCRDKCLLSAILPLIKLSQFFPLFAITLHRAFSLSPIYLYMPSTRHRPGGTT